MARSKDLLDTLSREGVASKMDGVFLDIVQLIQFEQKAAFHVIV